MLIQEFEERTGMTVTEEEFVEIHAMYVAAPESIDKDIFCKEWLKYKDSVLLNAFYKRTEYLQQVVNHYKQEKDTIVNFLLAEAELSNNPSLDSKAVVLVGYPEVIRRKITKGYTLTDNDKNFIKNNIQ